jgi:hypothetical protein
MAGARAWRRLEQGRRRLTRGPCGGLNEFKKFQTCSNPIQIHSNLFHSKKDLPKLKKIEIKYGFDKRYHFFHRHFSRFEVDLE